jgi:hypothetical protein
MAGAIHWLHKRKEEDPISHKKKERSSVSRESNSFAIIADNDK